VFLEPTAKILPRPKVPTHIDEETRHVKRLELANQPEPTVRTEADEIRELDDLLTDPQTQPLPLVARKPVGDSAALNDIASVGVQLANGGQRTFQTGPKLRLLQEMFGTPVNRTIRLVILVKM
jgi:hypothetical protein